MCFSLREIELDISKLARCLVKVSLLVYHFPQGYFAPGTFPFNE